ncbi:class I adenylate-forming enzyme family protein [Nocardia fusca]|uniref:class I adenylate-forming enzyme family protein n=1 Tax=Nocardia fusca TaxID=941183 RepID=UPI0037B6EED5
MVSRGGSAMISPGAADRPDDGEPGWESARQRFHEGMRAVLEYQPDERAMQYEGTWSSWRQVRELGESLAELLSDVPAGPVALVLRNRPSGVAALLGLLGSGRTIFLVSPIQPPTSIAADVARCSVVAVVGDAGDISPKPAALRGLCGIGLSSRTDGQLLAHLRPGGAVPHSTRAAPTIEVPPDTAIVVPTSGTTGPPKRIPLRWANLPLPRLGRERSVVINGLSSVTITGLSTLLRALARGRPVALLERLEVHAWAALVREHRPRLAGLPPAAMRTLLDSSVDPGDLASIEAWPTGSAPVPPSLQEEFERKFRIPVLVSYGATEFGGAVAGWSLEDHQQWAPAKRGSVGRANPGVSLRVVDQVYGRELGAGEIGLLEVRSPNAPVAPGQWVRTNDLAHIDDDGFLYIRGRADDVIVRGGFKVPLGELEAILTAHPAVTSAGAVGLADERLGQVPAVAVTVAAGAAPPSEQELKDWVRERAAPYKVPVLVRVVDNLPQTVSLKVSRPGLQRMLEPLWAVRR